MIWDIIIKQTLQGVTQKFWKDNILIKLGKYKRVITLPMCTAHSKTTRVYGTL